MRALCLMTFLFVAGEAHAMCGFSRPWVLPAPGEVPTNPTLFLFAPPGVAAPTPRVVSSEGVALESTLTQVHTFGTLRAWSLRIEAPAQTRFSIEGLQQGEEPFSLGPWTTGGAVSAAPLVLTRARDVSTSWSCSYEALRVLESSLDAPAYRVEYAPSERALKEGRRTTVVVAGSVRGAFTPSGEPVAQPPQKPRVSLGHHDCLGSNFTQEPVAVRVTALLPDGSERAAPQVFTLARIPGLPKP